MVIHESALNYGNTVLRKAHDGEAEKVYSMVADRVKWMDENDIHQWNDTDYLDVYPLEYYQENLEKTYVLSDAEDKRILCAAVILREDDRWDSDEPSLYIHNFVSALNRGGAGTVFIRKLEELAAEENIAYLRLDSADDNAKLCSYYRKLGFEPCGVCEDGKYHGILRQKKVKK